MLSPGHERTQDILKMKSGVTEAKSTQATSQPIGRDLKVESCDCLPLPMFTR